MFAHDTAVLGFYEHGGAQLALNGEVEVVVSRKLSRFTTLEPGRAGTVSNGWADERWDCVRREAAIKRESGSKSRVLAAIRLSKCEAGVVRRSTYRNQGAIRSRISAANHG